MTPLGRERQERLARLREENRQLGNKMTGHRRNAATLLQLVASLETSGGAEHGELRQIRPWNNGKEVPRWGVAEIQKMSPSTTGRFYCCH